MGPPMPKAPLVSRRAAAPGDGREGVVGTDSAAATAGAQGHALGPADATVSLGCWLDFACPFSKKQFKTLTESVVPHYSTRPFRLVFHHQVQPWHPQSALLHEAALAVAKLGGEEEFWKFAAALFANQTDFFDVHTVDLTRNQIYAKLVDLACASTAVDRTALSDLLKIQAGEELNPGSYLVTELKWEVKHGRLLGIHVSPSTTLNGLLFDSSSSWKLEDWQAQLDPFFT